MNLILAQRAFFSSGWNTSSIRFYAREHVCACARECARAWVFVWATKFDEITSFFCECVLFSLDFFFLVYVVRDTSLYELKSFAPLSVIYKLVPYLEVGYVKKKDICI